MYLFYNCEFGNFEHMKFTDLILNLILFIYGAVTPVL